MRRLRHQVLVLALEFSLEAAGVRLKPGLQPQFLGSRQPDAPSSATEACRREWHSGRGGPESHPTIAQQRATRSSVPKETEPR